MICGACLFVTLGLTPTRSVGLLGLDIVLPFSQTAVPRLEIVTGERGRQDVLVHVDMSNLHLLVGQDVAQRILESLHVGTQFRCAGRGKRKR